MNIKNIKELEASPKTADGLRIGALVTLDELANNAAIVKQFQSLGRRGARRLQSADPQHGNGGRRSVPAASLLVLPARATACSA